MDDSLHVTFGFPNPVKSPFWLSQPALRSQVSDGPVFRCKLVILPLSIYFVVVVVVVQSHCGLVPHCNFLI